MELEVEVISAICKNKDLSIAMSQGIEECFETHGDVYNYLKKYYKTYRGVPDTGVLTEKFPDFKPAEVAGTTQYHIDKLKDAYIKDRIAKLSISSLSDIKGHAGAKVLDHVRKEVTALSRLTNSVRDLDITDTDAAEQYFDRLRDITEDNGGTPGITTGIKAIDSAYPTGFAPGHLGVLIGWPGRGKSWLSEYMMCKAWEQGHSPMIISMEMSPEDMRNRIYTLMGSGLFNMKDFQRGLVNIDDFRSWSKPKMAGKPSFNIISNEGIGHMTTDTVQAKIDQYRPRFVVIDYHQLMTDSARSANATERNMNISRELKQCATRNGIPILDIVSATMQDIQDQEGPPLLSQVAWSKQIEYDADWAAAVHQHRGTNIVEVVDRKSRHGLPFAVYLEADFGRGIIKETYGNGDQP